MSTASQRAKKRRQRSRAGAATVQTVKAQNPTIEYIDRNDDGTHRFRTVNGAIVNAYLSGTAQPFAGESMIYIKADGPGPGLAIGRNAVEGEERIETPPDRPKLPVLFTKGEEQFDGTLDARVLAAGSSNNSANNFTSSGFGPTAILNNNGGSEFYELDQGQTVAVGVSGTVTGGFRLVGDITFNLIGPNGGLILREGSILTISGSISFGSSEQAQPRADIFTGETARIIAIATPRGFDVPEKPTPWGSVPIDNVGTFSTGFSTSEYYFVGTSSTASGGGLSFSFSGAVNSFQPSAVVSASINFARQPVHPTIGDPDRVGTCFANFTFSVSWEPPPLSLAELWLGGDRAEAILLKEFVPEFGYITATKRALYVFARTDDEAYYFIITRGEDGEAAIAETRYEPGQLILPDPNDWRGSLASFSDDPPEASDPCHQEYRDNLFANIQRNTLLTVNINQLIEPKTVEDRLLDGEKVDAVEYTIQPISSQSGACQARTEKRGKANISAIVSPDEPEDVNIVGIAIYLA